MAKEGPIKETKTDTSYVTVVDASGLSDQAISLFTWIVVTGICQTIGVFGIVTNIINVMCFVKQGVNEPVNISLMCLSISDLGCLATQIGMNVMFTFTVCPGEFSFDSLDVMYLTASIPHLAFNRVSSWITAIITLERCLCITVPLKVKSIVTTERVWISISCVYVICLFSAAPSYVVNRLGPRFYPTRNRTILAILSTSDREKVEEISFTINSLIIPFIALIIIITCTVVLVVSLKKRTKWRKKSTTDEQSDLSGRDQKVAKMVVMISVLFICCLVPLCVIILAMGLEPRLHLTGDLIEITKCLANIGVLMESINSSANIFIYYRMSRKYRETFHTIFIKIKVPIPSD